MPTPALHKSEVVECRIDMIHDGLAIVSSPDEMYVRSWHFDNHWGPRGDVIKDFLRKLEIDFMMLKEPSSWRCTHRLFFGSWRSAHTYQSLWYDSHMTGFTPIAWAERATGRKECLWHPWWLIVLRINLHGSSECFYFSRSPPSLKTAKVMLQAPRRSCWLAIPIGNLG